MAVITLGSPSFDPIVLDEAVAYPTDSGSIEVVDGGEMTAMIGETDPIFSAWDKHTGITIHPSQIIPDDADIVPLGLALSSQGLTAGTQSAYVVLTWTAIVSDTFDHYQIRYKRNTFSAYTYLNSSTNTISIEGLVANTLYNFGVASVNTSGITSAFSTDINVTTTADTTQPATVADVSATAAIESIKLSWTANSDVDISSYNIYRCATEDGVKVLIANISGTYFLDGGLTSGDIQYYWLKAVDTSGNISANFSTVASAIPTSGLTQTELESILGANLEDISIINPVTGYINANTVGTAQIDNEAVTAAKILDGTITAAKTSIAAINSSTGEINANTVGTTQIQDEAINAAQIANDAITAAALAPDSVTGPAILAGSILAGHITAGEIQTAHLAAGAVTAAKITTANFVLAEGTFTSNTPTDSISWADCVIVYNGVEYAITDGTCDVADNHIYWEYKATTFSHSVALPTLGNDDFLVAFNNAGTYSLVWNSTVINGNRITTGSIVASNLAAGTITANEIATGTITAVNIAAGAITASKITSYNFIVDGATNAFTGNSVDTISWTGVKVYYEGVEYVITDNSTTDFWVYWEKPNTTFSTSGTLPSLTNNGFLVCWNDDGDPVILWTATTINGNRITAGSISTGHLAAGCITANKIGADQIVGTHILAGEITVDKLSVTNLAAISATLGNVTSGSIVITTGANKIWLSDGDDGMLALGGSTKATAPFRVTAAGVLTATSGTIGGWSIDSSYIWSGTKLVGDGYTAAPGDITLNSTDGSIHTYNFYSDADGEFSFRATTPEIDGVKTIKLDLGGWDMDANQIIYIDTGLSVVTYQVVSASVLIYKDDEITAYPLDLPNGSWSIAESAGPPLVYVFTLYRTASGSGGAFDSTDFDNSLINRGYIVLNYIDRI